MSEFWGTINTNFLRRIRMRKSLVIVTGLAISAALVCAADEQQPLNLNTGLWQVEYSVTYSGLPPQMQAMVDRMTQQQRAAMGLDAPKTFKWCVTPKNLNTPWGKGDNNCRWTVVKSTSSDLEVHGSGCRAGAGSNTDVDVKIHAIDPTHVRAVMHGTQTGGGVNATMDGNYTGKFISASCSGEPTVTNDNTMEKPEPAKKR